MKKIFAPSIAAVLCLVVLFGCKKESETLPVASMTDYFPLQTGRWYLYRLDSTVPAPFGTALIVKSYQAKDTIESTFSDNEGRLSYRIFRFIRDTAGVQPWRFAATYTATPAAQWIEYVDNNLRFLKLHAPVTDGYTWKAHSFIDTKSINSEVAYLDEWEYEYRNTGQTYRVFNTDYDSTATVFQQDETTPDVPFTPDIPYQQHNFAIEVYAKGVGLIYKEFIHWIWQTNPPPSKYDDGSYGVKLRLISHN